jgi:hypothetical protein
MRHLFIVPDNKPMEFTGAIFFLTTGSNTQVPHNINDLVYWHIYSKLLVNESGNHSGAYFGCTIFLGYLEDSTNY